MDYRCMLGSLGDSSTAPRNSDAMGAVGPSYSQAGGTSFFSCPV